MANLLDPATMSQAQLEQEILSLKKQRNAVILAHFYQDDDIQDIADFIGDSLDLSRKAAATDADVIAFCGVRFMAEVAKIVSPQKTVVLPDIEAGCSLETSCPPEPFAAFKAAHPDHLVLTYVNCSADIKALSDIIVTSSNAEHIISQLPQDQKIIFAPDKHLGSWLNKKTGRNMVLWDGACMVHERFSEKELVKLKVRHPDAVFIAHPECPEAILQHAEHVGSTSSLLNFVKTSTEQKIIIGTEPGILHQMQKSAPQKTLIPLPGNDGSCFCNDCPYMKLNTMQKLYLCLRDLKPEITLTEEKRLAALKPLERMLKMS